MVPIPFQGLKDLAEPIRDNEISKKEMNSHLWQILQEVVTADPSLQSDEPPTRVAQASKSSSSSTTAPQAPLLEVCSHNPVCRLIAQRHPHLSAVQVAAEYFVDQCCLPKFASGEWSDDFARCVDGRSWDLHYQDIKFR